MFPGLGSAKLENILGSYVRRDALRRIFNYNSAGANININCDARLYFGVQKQLLVIIGCP
jgi:hypothetical protein